MAEEGSLSSLMQVPNASSQSHHLLVGAMSTVQLPAPASTSTLRISAWDIRCLVYGLCPKLRKSKKLLMKCLKDPTHREMKRKLIPLLKEYGESRQMLKNTLSLAQLQQNIPQESRMENYRRMLIREEMKKLPEKIREILQQMLQAEHEHQEQLRKELEELRIHP